MNKILPTTPIDFNTQYVQRYVQAALKEAQALSTIEEVKYAKAAPPERLRHSIRTIRCASIQAGPGQVVRMSRKNVFLCGRIKPLAAGHHLHRHLYRTSGTSRSRGTLPIKPLGWNCTSTFVSSVRPCTRVRIRRESNLGSAINKRQRRPYLWGLQSASLQTSRSWK